MATTASGALAHARGVLVRVALLSVAAPSSAAAQSDLERARAMYNAGQFDESIAAAAVAKDKPWLAPSATLIAARARLERFRQNGDPEDLGAARGRSRLAEPTRPRAAGNHRVADWPRHGAVSRQSAGPGRRDVRDRAADRARAAVAAEFDKLLEWWASTCLASPNRRRAPRVRKRTPPCCRRCADELERNPLSRPAAYWLVVAARGAGDLDGCMERGGHRLDSRRLAARGRAASRRPRPLRDADTHPRTGAGAHGPAPRCEDHPDRDCRHDRAVARARRTLAAANRVKPLDRTARLTLAAPATNCDNSLLPARVIIFFLANTLILKGLLSMRHSWLRVGAPSWPRCS